MTKVKKQIIIFDRIQLYRDFVINLINYIKKYYIDDGSFDEEDVELFYNWCFNKVCDEFKEEDIDFSDNKNLRKYFKKYFYDNYFFADTNIRFDHEFSLSFWDGVLSSKNLENKKLLYSFVEIYSIFDETIEKRIASSTKKDVHV